MQGFYDNREKISQIRKLVNLKEIEKKGFKTVENNCQEVHKIGEDALEIDFDLGPLLALVLLLRILKIGVI